MSRLVTLCLTLMGCWPGAEVKCISTCGLRLIGASEDCRGFQLAEDRALRELNKYQGDLCSSLEGMSVEVKPETAWTDGWGRRVAGLTFCQQGPYIQIGTDDWFSNSLTHELIHAALECPWNNNKHEGANWAGPYLESIRLSRDP